MKQSNRTDQLLTVFPLGAEVGPTGHLCLGGCDAVELASRFGTPLYVFDEATLRARCAEFVREFSGSYSNSGVIYAAKAFINPALASLIASEGLGLDVVSGGELAVARAAAFPPKGIYFHGNNKSRAELEQAVDYRVGRVVVDNFHEIGILDSVALEKGVGQDIMLRINPGVDAHTHAKITTGVVDSKFGFSLAGGQAEEALRRALCAGGLNLVGLHCHIGSQVFEVEPYLRAIDVMLGFAAEMKAKHGFELMEFSPGGGFGVQYLVGQPPPHISEYAKAISSKVHSACKALGLAAPRLVVEPGRAIVGQAGVALYTVGSIKDVPGIRKYVCVDGGMGDNIRPALYEAEYEAMLANRAADEAGEHVTIAGRYCESGDILVKDAVLPPASAGDLVAIPVSGAYAMSMASNYNAVPRPAVVIVKDGGARLIRRRETYQDLTARDVA